MGDGLASDGILLIVEGDNNLCGIEEILGGGVLGEEKVSNGEIEFHEGPELERLAVAGALHLFVGLES